VKQNMGALDVAITADELRQFRTQLAQVKVVGARAREEAVRDQ
jgi:hypothetical protein